MQSAAISLACTHFVSHARAITCLPHSVCQCDLLQLLPSIQIGSALLLSRTVPLASVVSED